MKIKSYYAKTITEAIEKARLELGSDAMIIASHKTTGAAQRLGVFEVVFGINSPSQAGPPNEAGAPKEVGAPAAPSEGLQRMRARMEDLRESVSKKREQAAQAKLSPAGRAKLILTRIGFPAPVADEVTRSMQSRSRDPKQDIVGLLRAELSARLRVAPKLGLNGQGRSIAALVGPPGVGKTSMLVKLAVRHGLAAGRPVRFISMDSERLGGSDLLRRYAEAMAAPFDVAGDPEALDGLLGASDRGGLVLIDTAGVAIGGPDKAAPLAAFLSKRAEIDVHLVLPAYASYSVLEQMTARFKPFFASKVIFTGLDNCATASPILAHAMATDSPVSFLGTGQEVPEDLEEASGASLVARVLPSLMEAAASAA